MHGCFCYCNFWRSKFAQTLNLALVILAAPAIEGGTQAIYGGVVVFAVNDNQAATSTLICHPSSEYLATHRAHGTTGTVPSAINFSTPCKSPSVTSYILPADSQDILAALAIVGEKTDSHEKRFRCC